MPPKQKGSTAAHQKLLKQWALAVTEFDLDYMTLPYTVGVFRDFDSAERIIHAGQVGVFDNLVITTGGNILWFDAKTGQARFSKEQRDFKARVDAICGYEACHKLKSVDVGLEILEKYRRNIRSNK